MEHTLSATLLLSLALAATVQAQTNTLTVDRGGIKETGDQWRRSHWF